MWKDIYRTSSRRVPSFSLMFETSLSTGRRQSLNRQRDTGHPGQHTLTEAHKETGRRQLCFPKIYTATCFCLPRDFQRLGDLQSVTFPWNFLSALRQQSSTEQMQTVPDGKREMEGAVTLPGSVVHGNWNPSEAPVPPSASGLLRHQRLPMADVLSIQHSAASPSACLAQKTAVKGPCSSSDRGLSARLSHETPSHLALRSREIWLTLHKKRAQGF